ncbi:hypothetical protein [Pseudoclavibacter helvolus]|uniref:hypothetical protein n=1 Tax=Pseudoclavibacter helvolus TaxID=255205 RepID=UPI003C743F93
MEETSRRGVLKAAAWATPIIAVAAVAPAAVASPCSKAYQGVLRLTTGQSQAPNYTRSTPTSGTASVTLDGAPAVVAPINVSVTSVFTSNYTPATNADPIPRNLQTGPYGLSLMQLRSGASTSSTQGQTVTFTFSRPVSDLRFTLGGFTWPTDQSYRDAGYFTATPASYANPSQVTGSGIAASPWVTSVQQSNPPVTAANTVTNLLFPGAISSLTFHYYSATSRTDGGENSPQAVYFSDMAFRAAC